MSTVESILTFRDTRSTSSRHYRQIRTVCKCLIRSNTQLLRARYLFAFLQISSKKRRWILDLPNRLSFSAYLHLQPIHIFVVTVDNQEYNIDFFVFSSKPSRRFLEIRCLRRKTSRRFALFGTFLAIFWHTKRPSGGLLQHCLWLGSIGLCASLKIWNWTCVC